jgi:hypothetical protein
MVLLLLVVLMLLQWRRLLPSVFEPNLHRQPVRG